MGDVSLLVEATVARMHVRWAHTKVAVVTFSAQGAQRQGGAVE